ncbi:MAG: hypothetical protein GC136_11315 [Alphaproteobacteria bacterium]|nr:hypothetical protein [Alphaproteobacteria bacterium]
MAYWVYENWTHEKAVVHKSECTFCRDGKGLHGTSGNGNDKWHGPFVSKEAALETADQTERQLKKCCEICCP